VMFKCILQQHIYRDFDYDGSKELGCEARMKLELPFAPNAGMNILKNQSIKLLSVTFDCENSTFMCACEPSYLKPMDGCGYEGLKNIAIEDGWIIANELAPGNYED